MNKQKTARPTLIEAGLNFYRWGYFVRPPDRDQSGSWLEIQDLIVRLSQGDFIAVPKVLEMSRQTQDWRLKAVAIRVLGHSGSVDCFRKMREELERFSIKDMAVIDVKVREMILLYSGAFASWGRLDVVQVLMRLYLDMRTKKTPEISLLPLLMADLLTDERGAMIAHEPPEDRLEDYLNLVMNRYNLVVETLGSDKVHVFRGELQSVSGFAEKMRHITTEHVSTELHQLRRRFEPATGIDCSEVFGESSISPLVAAEIAERFLNSSQAGKFEPGARYFFGHRIPD